MRRFHFEIVAAVVVALSLVQGGEAVGQAGGVLPRGRGSVSPVFRTDYDEEKGVRTLLLYLPKVYADLGGDRSLHLVFIKSFVDGAPAPESDRAESLYVAVVAKSPEGFFGRGFPEHPPAEFNCNGRTLSYDSKGWKSEYGAEDCLETWEYAVSLRDLTNIGETKSVIIKFGEVSSKLSPGHLGAIRRFCLQAHWSSDKYAASLGSRRSGGSDEPLAAGRGAAGSTRPVAPPLEGECVRVIGGDMIVVDLPEGGETPIRLIGVELPDDTEKVEAAKNKLAELTLGKSVSLLRDPHTTRDELGRRMHYVLVRDKDISRELIRAGLTTVLAKYKLEPSRYKALRAAQDEAKEAKVGIWGDSR